jgi:hypothetical protein
VIKGNFIGSDVSGTGAIPNTSNGIYVHDDMGGSQSPEPFTIGGTEPGAGNLISGNAGPGVLLKQADQITVYGNSIGTRLDGTTPLPNAGAGVLVYWASNNIVGGTVAGQGNTIAFNGADGVRVDGISGTTTGDTIRGTLSTTTPAKASRPSTAETTS